MTPPDAHHAPARSDKTEDWDARHAQSRAIEQQAGGSFKAVDKVPSAPATAEVRARKLLSRLVTWAEQRCPCDNDQPAICPLCGADVAKDQCLAADVSFPRSLLRDMRLELAQTQNSLTAPASAASFMDGVEAIEAARDRYVAAVDPDPSARTAWQSGAIEDGFRLSLAAVRALTPPAASQDSGADFPKCREPARDVREIVTDIAATGGEPSGEIVQGVAGLLADIGKLRLDLTAERERADRAHGFGTEAHRKWGETAVALAESTARADALQQRVGALEAELLRARVIISQTPTPNAKTEGV